MGNRHYDRTFQTSDSDVLVDIFFDDAAGLDSGLAYRVRQGLPGGNWEHTDSGPIYGLDELCALLNEHGFAMDFDLPTFGGTKPVDTEGVFSWDAGSILINDGDEGKWEVRSRHPIDY